MKNLDNQVYVMQGLNNQVHLDAGSYQTIKKSFIQVHEHKAKLNLNRVQNKKIDEWSDDSSKRRL